MVVSTSLSIGAKPSAAACRSARSSARRPTAASRYGATSNGSTTYQTENVRNSTNDPTTRTITAAAPGEIRRATRIATRVTRRNADQANLPGCSYQ